LLTGWAGTPYDLPLLIAIRPTSIGPDKTAFHRYLEDFGSSDNEQALLDSLAQCSDALPARYADLLGLPPASTYRDAVKLLLAPWMVLRPGAL
jgi:hypothetical protein